MRGSQFTHHVIYSPLLPSLSFGIYKKDSEHRLHWPLLALALYLFVILFSLQYCIVVVQHVRRKSSLLPAPKLIARDHSIEMLGPDRLIIALLKIVDRLQIAMTTDPTGSYLQREYVFLMGLDGHVTVLFLNE
jgi:hypothetical protein